MPVQEHVTLEGGAETEARLAAMSKRFAFPGPGLRTAFEVLEEGEKSVFENFAGAYVLTGALRDSLTESNADGAVRRLMPTDAEFGSSLDEGGYHPIVLRVSEAQTAEAGKLLMEYLMHGAAVEAL